MGDFIMTLDSDDEGPQERLTTLSNSKPSKPSKNTNGKLTRKQQQQQQAATAANSTSKSKAAKGKKKLLDNDVDSDDERHNSTRKDDGAIDAQFHFDSLGGGFVASTANLVWDAGQPYITKRPNALPRVTVDEIIARRAPERDAALKESKKLKRKQEKAAAAAALADGSDEEEEDDSEDELEKEMREDLENGFEVDDDFGASASDVEDEEDLSGQESEEEEGERSDQVEGEIEDDQEDWLGIGEEAQAAEKDENESGSDQGESDEDEEADEEEESGATGFAALADMEDDEGLSDVDSQGTSADVDDESQNPTDAAASKFFTSHKNSSLPTDSASNTFASLPNCTLSRPLLLALGSLGLSNPTAIQRECIPVAMMGKDIVASSKTGSGKTVAFWVGVLERLLHRDRKHPATRVVVMTPTRELAVQVHGVGKALARYTDVEFCLCVGGLSLKVQEAELKQRPDVVVSTPGRLIDHVRNTPCFTMDSVEVLVLDEADRMLEEGFRDELEEIIQAAPRSRQTLLFSATVTESITALQRVTMNHPVRVKIDEMGATASGLVQEFLRVRGDKPGEAIERGFRSGERMREALLMALCTRSFSSGRTIIFFRAKAQAHRMKILFSLFGRGLEKSDELHGDLTQEQRLTSLKRFREGECAFLLATDLASRGLDIKGIENVINYEMPKSIEIYLHRVGRTARAGRQGRALTLVGESDRKLVKLAMKHAPPESIKQRVVPPEVVSKLSAELQELETEVKGVMREEKEEKEIRRGNMEITKGLNMIEHEAEIKARPARTWFQSEQEKRQAKNLGIAEHNSKFLEKPKKRKADDEEEPLSRPPKRTPFSGLSRKEKRRKMAADEDRLDRESGDKNKLEASFRSAKKAARPGKMTVAAPPRDPNASQKKPKKKKKQSVFDREIGQAGKVERSAGGGGGGSPSKRQSGGSAGKGKGKGGFGKGKRGGRK